MLSQRLAEAQCPITEYHDTNLRDWIIRWLIEQGKFDMENMYTGTNFEEMAHFLLDLLDESNNPTDSNPTALFNKLLVHLDDLYSSKLNLFPSDIMVSVLKEKRELCTNQKEDFEEKVKSLRHTPENLILEDCIEVGHAAIRELNDFNTKFEREMAAWTKNRKDVTNVPQVEKIKEISRKSTSLFNTCELISVANHSIKSVDTYERTLVSDKLLEELSATLLQSLKSRLD
jgi:hypothetical protein